MLPEWLKIILDLAPLGGIIVFVIGLYKYHRSNEISFRKPFWERQFALYEEAASAAATLATTDDEAQWHAARNAFWRLYYGPLCLVEDNAVLNAMWVFGDSLKRLGNDPADRFVLEKLAYRLAEACRDSIRTDWQVPLDELKPPSGAAG